MTRWLAILISLTLMSCKTPSKPRASLPLQTYVETASEAKAAGLTLTELSDIEAFFDFVHSGCRTGQYRIDSKFSHEERAELRRILSERFARQCDPHFILLENDQNLRLGISFSPSTHRLHVLDPSVLSGYDYFLLTRKSSGYDITRVDGCVHTQVKIVKNRGRPFIITVERPD